ncbi:MAG: UvrB/UvrC motif-containing protein, partial [Clostridia bacterium]|nr:UvrB/UvrC motif-containing protein [Clostridia bacterium]
NETNRRRAIQDAYNKANGITPQTIIKDVREVIEMSSKVDDTDKAIKKMPKIEREKLIAKLSAEMREAAKMLEFEHAAYLRDKIKLLKGEK